MKPIFYEGNSLQERIEVLDIDPYLPGKKLVKAVRLAQILGRPLLIKGEPGCGKTRLAQAVAYELFKDKYKENYFEWNIKSNTKAQDGLYTINYLQRLRDANIPEKAGGDPNLSSLDIVLKKNKNGTYDDKGKYIQLGELGKAFQQSTVNLAGKKLPPPVLLIDEIDKADLDFPNDLLLEMDRMRFTIPEARDQDNNPVEIVTNKKFRPLIFITSNDEKPLPPAFLRRCLFHYIDFEDIKVNLPMILERNYPGLSNEFINTAITEFTAWRDLILNKGTSMKNVSTSELLDWIKIVNYYRNENTDKPYEKGQSVMQWIKSIDDFYLSLETTLSTGADGKLPPYYAALLKDTDSIKNFIESVPETTEK